MRTLIKTNRPGWIPLTVSMAFMWLFALSMAAASPANHRPDGQKERPGFVRGTPPTTPTVTISPAASVYTEGQSVTLTFTGLTENTQYGVDIDGDGGYYNQFGSPGNSVSTGPGQTSATLSGTFGSGSAGTNRRINIFIVGSNTALASTAPFTIVPPISLVTKATPISVCTGSTATLSVTATDGSSPYTYAWNAPSGASITGATNTSTISVSALTSGTKTFTVTVTGSGGSPVSTTSIVNLTVSNKPAITMSPYEYPSLTVCAGKSLTLTATGAGAGGSYQWSTGEITAAISVSITNTYSVTGTTQSGCTSVTSVFFDARSLPTATISALPALTVCAGRSVSLTASGMPGGLSPRLATTFSAPALWYTWSTGSTDATTIFTPTSTTVISLTINDGSCTGTTAATITVTNSPTVSIAASATSLTGGQNTTLTASGADSYTWSTNATTNPITVAPLSTTVYSVTGTQNGCTGVASQTIALSCTDAVAKAISATVVSVLGPNNCSVTVQGQGTGSSFVMTGPNGYVFSTVYRRVGTYSLSAQGVKQPGTYTFTASATNTCGQVYSDSITYIVTGTACP